MGFVKSYALPRLVQWAVVIFIGTTVTFIIPRLLPTDPVEATMRRVSTSQTDPRAVQTFREALQDLYGLQGTPLEQYGRFWARLVRADLGPSLGAFPTPVTQIIRDGLPWTVGLLGASTLISWLLGIVLGTMAAYYPRSRWSNVVGGLLVTVYPVPYFILALVLVLVFAYYIPLFPLVGGASGSPSNLGPYLLGALFEGALITEFVFSYPGIGYRLYTAILQSDFNMIMGVTIFSIVGIATAALLIDLLYPLFDPRVRLR